MDLVNTFQAKEVKAVYDHFRRLLGDDAADAALLTQAYFSAENAERILKGLDRVSSAAKMPEDEKKREHERRQHDPHRMLG